MTCLAAKVAVPQQVVFRDLDGEAVILELESGRYYGLDAVGTQMWHRLQQHGEVRAAYQGLLQEYQVSEDELRRDLLEFVDRLASMKLLELDEE